MGGFGGFGGFGGSLMIHNNLVLPKSSMIQREFQLEVWILKIQMSTVIPPSSMVLFFHLFHLVNLSFSFTDKNIKFNLSN